MSERGSLVILLEDKYNPFRFGRRFPISSGMCVRLQPDAKSFSNCCAWLEIAVSPSMMTLVFEIVSSFNSLQC